MRPFAGVYAAALTPLNPDSSIKREDLPKLLEFLSQRGCHGALLLGTTGEGPSFAPEERAAILKTASLWRRDQPDFRLLAGTGTPSLEETVALTRTAFDLDFDGVVVLPPYYFRQAPDAGLFKWFSDVLQRAVPTDGAFFGYHIPAVSGVALSIDLLNRLKDTFPKRFAGIKDSSGQFEHAQNFIDCFGDDLMLLVGNDRLFSQTLEIRASGCITALANMRSPDLRAVWDAHLRSESNPQAQTRLNAARDVLERYPPFPAPLKALLPRFHEFDQWAVRPPLLPLPQEITDRAEGEMLQAITG
jgi:4-hydroxy-tetrahydrodipicolinate synthase